MLLIQQRLPKKQRVHFGLQYRIDSEAIELDREDERGDEDTAQDSCGRQ